LLFADILEAGIELAGDIGMHPTRDADAARIGQAFEAGGQIHPVAEYVALLDDDVADIDAHAKFDAALCRCRGVVGAHLLLQLDRTAHRVDDAGELGKQAVAGRFDDAAPMLGDFGIGEFTANPRNAASVPSSSSPISRE
jgi:hypothetical protein